MGGYELEDWSVFDAWFGGKDTVSTERNNNNKDGGQKRHTHTNSMIPTVE